MVKLLELKSLKSNILLQFRPFFWGFFFILIFNHYFGLTVEKIIFNFNIFDGVKTAMLCESEFSKEIRITMAKDAVMKEHMAPNAIIVQVLRGGIEFEMSGKILVMNEFDMITLPAFIPHSLKALEKSIIRLSLSKSDSHTRVFKVANSKK